jgi:integrase
LDEEREWCQVKAANRKSLANPGTVNREVGLLRSMINLAAEWFALELKPIKYEMAKEEPKERILTEQEIRRLIENSEEPLRHIILVALNTGMRKTEILNLEWDQVNLEEGFIRIEAQRSKNRKIREEKKEKGDRQDTINRHTDIILDYS